MIPRPLRLLAAAALATVVTFVVIAAVMRLFNPPQKIEDAVYDKLVDKVDVLDLTADPTLRKAVEDSIKGRAPVAEVEAPKKPTAPLVPPREVRGFVQVEVRLDEHGKIEDARVVGAVPPGVYDQQALAEVRARSYSPLMIDGRAVPGKVTEIVPFTVNVPAAPAKKGR